MRTTTPRLVLASASPARRRLLQAAGIEPEIIVSGVDESAVEASDAETLAGTLARLKAEAVADRLRRDPGTSLGTAVKPSTAAASTATTSAASTATTATPGGGVLVLGCDSVLALDREIFGKPANAAEAADRWRRMRGRSGVLHTGHCLVDLAGGRSAEAVASTAVQFADVTDDEIAAYVGSGEPMRVAGAFTIDGLGGSFVERIEGDAGNVIGLSLPLLRRLLGKLDVQIIDLWRTTR